MELPGQTRLGGFSVGQFLPDLTGGKRLTPSPTDQTRAPVTTSPKYGHMGIFLPKGVDICRQGVYNNYR